MEPNCVIDHWTSHATAYDQTANIALTKDQRDAITVEFHDITGAAVARL